MAQQLKILLIDVPEGPGSSLLEVLGQPSGPAIVTACLGRIGEAPPHLGEPVDAILVDPGPDGLAGVRRILELAPKVPIVVLTGSDDGELGVAAIEAGAEDFIARSEVKPTQLGQSLHAAVRRHLVRIELESENRRLESEADVDPLTGLLNRRGLDKMLPEVVRAAMRAGSTLTALLVDCDDFGRVNKLHGHDVGDALLRELAGSIGYGLRSSDLVARVGGDEFLVLLPGTRPVDAFQMADRICTLVAGRTVIVHSDEVGATVSIGVADLDLDEVLSIDIILAEAHDALARSKREGKNRAVTTHATPRAAASEVEDLIAGGNIGALAQPIVDIETGARVGFELFSRGPFGPLRLPEDIFRNCSREGHRTTADLRCLEACVREAESARLEGRVHLNVLSETICDTAPSVLIQMLSALADNDVCLEIMDLERASDLHRLAEPIDKLQEHGVEIALDHGMLSAEHLEAAVFLAPTYVKLDPRFLRMAESDPHVKRALQRLVGMLASVDGTAIGTEVETEDQRTLLIECGLRFAQGFLWSRPRAPRDFGRALSV